MDVVDALNKYRFAVTRDDLAFSILCYLYIRPEMEEGELYDSLGVSLAQIKPRLRDMYKSHLIELSGPNSYKISYAAAQILAGLNADEYLMPSLFDRIASEKSRTATEQLYKFVVKNDKHLKTDLRHRLVVFSGHGSRTVPQKLRDDLVLFSMVDPDSLSRAMLKTGIVQMKHGHISSDWSKQLQSQARVYARLAEAIDESDALLQHAATSPKSVKEFSAAGKSYTAWRLMSYLTTPQPDIVLEACHFANPNVSRLLVEQAVSTESKGSLFAKTFKAAARLLNVTLAESEPAQAAAAFSELFTAVLKSKASTQGIDIVALLPRPPVSEIEPPAPTATDLIRMLETVTERFGPVQNLKVGRSERARAEELLNSIHGLIGTSTSPKKV